MREEIQEIGPEELLQRIREGFKDSPLEGLERAIAKAMEDRSLTADMVHYAYSQ